VADIDTIRTAGNWSDGLLLIDEPTVIYTANATGAVDEEDWSIGFDSGDPELDLGDCRSDMTLLIGSEELGCDKGIARLRKAPEAGVFYIGIDASLVVEDGDHLTVVDDFEPFAKHPLDELLDVDVAYVDQFEDFDPIPWFNGRCVVIKAGETAVFDATLAWVPGSTISGWTWTFTGATSSTGTDTATPTATYDDSGRFRVELEIEATNGKKMTGYGYVFVLGENLAAEADVAISAPEWDADAGALCTVEMFDRPAIRDGARAIVFARDWYEGTEQSFGPVAGRENILIEGRIIGETIIRIPGWDKVEFAIGGPIADLAETAAMVSGLVDKSLPTDDGITLPAWSKMDGLTVAKGLHYLAVHRSTIARCLDIHVEDWGWSCPKLTGSGDSLYQQLVNYAERAALSVRADRLGRIFVERDAQLYPVADRDDIPVIFTAEDADWQDELTIVRRQRGETAMAEAEGEIFSGGARTKVGGRSPGHQPARHGGGDDLDEVYVATKANVRSLAGLLAGSKNQEIERITWRTAHNNRLLDVTPRMYVQAVVDGETLRCIPRNISPTPNEGTGFWHMEIELEPEGEEWPAVDITYPGDGEPPIPPPPEPPPTPPPQPPPPPPPPESSEVDAVVSCANIQSIKSTADLDEASPTWSAETS